MNIQETIERALASAGLDTQSGPLRGVTDTIRNEKFRDRYLKQIPLGRFAGSEEVAPATWFFLTDAASYVTGQHLSVDGGFHIAT